MLLTSFHGKIVVGNSVGCILGFMSLTLCKIFPLSTQRKYLRKIFPLLQRQFMQKYVKVCTTKTRMSFHAK